MLIAFLCEFNGHVICVLSFPAELHHLSHITQSIQAFPLKEDPEAWETDSFLSKGVYVHMMYSKKNQPMATERRKLLLDYQLQQVRYKT